MTRGLAMLTGLALVLSGCPAFPNQGNYTCNSDKDCANGKCIGGACNYGPNGPGVDCASDNDCQQRFGGSSCQNGYCVLTGCAGATCAPDAVCGSAGCEPANAATCRSDMDCPFHFVCTGDGGFPGTVCLRACQNLQDCTPGWRCAPSGNMSVCVPATCGPTNADINATFGGACKPDGNSSGTCVGPLGGKLQTAGLCFSTGDATGGQPCDLRAPVSTAPPCRDGNACATQPPMHSLPPSNTTTCQRICKGWEKLTTSPCGGDTACYPMWGALGVCVVREPGATTTITGTCTGQTFSETTPADDRPCADGTLCAPDGVCHGMCTLGVAGQCASALTCTAFDSPIPGHPYLGYCK